MESLVEVPGVFGSDGPLALVWRLGVVEDVSVCKLLATIWSLIDSLTVSSIFTYVWGDIIQNCNKSSYVMFWDSPPILFSVDLMLVVFIIHKASSLLGEGQLFVAVEARSESCRVFKFLFCNLVEASNLLMQNHKQTYRNGSWQTIEWLSTQNAVMSMVKKLNTLCWLDSKHHAH